MLATAVLIEGSDGLCACEEFVKEDATMTAQILLCPHCWCPHTILQSLKMDSRGPVLYPADT